MHQLSGFSGIIFYSTELFTEGKDGVNAERKARIGTLGIGIMCFLGTAVGIPVTKWFTRKFIFLVGQVMIFLCLLFLGIFAIIDSQVLLTIAALAISFCFNMTMAGLMWLYTSEILPTKGTSLVGMVNLIGALGIGACTNLLFELLSPPGFYFTFSGIQIITFVFIFIFVKETKGKTKDECLKVYYKDMKIQNSNDIE
jgi:facilitated trehalose transporter